MTVTFTPFGVASEYSCRGWRPTGSSLSCVGPAIGRLMFANRPPFSLFHFQICGGVYGGASVMAGTPELNQAGDSIWSVLRSKRPSKYFASAPPNKLSPGFACANKVMEEWNFK